MAEPRRPIGNLPGEGETSISAARPIDAFAPPPPMPKNTAADQLAKAFGNLGAAGRKASQQAEAKRERERIDLMAETARDHAVRMAAESENGIITSVQLGEHYADLSDAIIARIVREENNTSFYNMAKDKLSGLSDDIIMNKGALESIYTKLEEDAIASTTNQETGEIYQFAQGGALRGIRRAIQEKSGQHAQKRDSIVRDRAQLITKGQVTTLLDSAYTDGIAQTGDINMTAIIEGIAAIDKEVSPFDNVTRKGIIVDAILAWDKNNPDKAPLTDAIMEKVPFLKGSVTEAKVANARGAIASARMTHLRNEAFIANEAEKEQFNINVADVNAITEGDLSVANQIKKLDELQRDMAIAAAKDGANASEVKIANDTWAYIETMKRSLEVPPDESSANRIKVRTTILSGATSGTLTVDQAIAQVRARDDISPNDKATLINEIPQLIQGGGIIATETHNTAYRQRVGGSVDAYDKDKTLMGVGLKLSMVGESVDSIAREIWDDTTINLIEQHMEENDGQLPNIRAMNEIYDKAEDTVKSRLAELNKLKETAGNMSPAQVRDRVDTLTDEGYDPTKDINSDQFKPVKDQVYPAPSGEGNVKYIGKLPDDPFNDENWVLVGDDGEEIVTPEPEVTVTETDTNTTVSRNKTVAKEQAEEREAVAGGYNDLSEIFSQENQEFNLPEDTLNTLLEQVTNTPLKRRQTSVPDSTIKDIILKQLGLEGNSYFDFGGLDDANLDGEVAVEKLIERLKELDQR
jgi:hypothetical protein